MLKLQKLAVPSPESSAVGPDPEFSLILAVLLDGSLVSPSLGGRILDVDSVSNFHPVLLRLLTFALLTDLAEIAVRFVESALNGFLVLGFVRVSGCGNAVA